MVAEVLSGIERVTDAHGYQTMLAHYGYHAEREEMRLMSLLSYNIDGLILSERSHTERTRKMIEVAGIQVVEIMDSESTCIDLAVGFNNFEAVYQMTQVLLARARGHRFPVYLGSRLDERTLIKMQGYEQATRDVSTDRPSSYSLGGELMREARERYPETDSLFCTNDDIAIGAAFECQREGLYIPDQMAIAGFHGHDIGQSMEPKLASVLTPRERMGQVAAERLLARLRGEVVTPPRLDLSFTILHGGSI